MRIVYTHEIPSFYSYSLVALNPRILSRNRVVFHFLAKSAIKKFGTQEIVLTATVLVQKHSSGIS